MNTWMAANRLETDEDEYKTTNPKLIVDICRTSVATATDFSGLSTMPCYPRPFLAEYATVGIDLAKNVFSCVASTSAGTRFYVKRSAARS